MTAPPSWSDTEAAHPGATPSDEVPPPADRRGPLGLTLPGLWGALAFVCLSLTPSLLPRNGVTQGLVSGLSAVTGYGVGLAIAAVWRSLADRPARPGTRRGWRTTAIVGGVLVVLALAFGWSWQRDLRALMGAPRPALWATVVTPIVAVLVFAVVLLVARAVRRAATSAGGLLARYVGRRAASTLGWLLTGTLVVLLVTGVLLDGFVALADRTFSVRDTTTDEGVQRPTSGLRSGGSGSVVPWDSLGRQGRSFVGGGPSGEDIASFAGVGALEPVRAYAGIATDTDVEVRAAAVVDDLQRAGGFERSHLLVATTTGTGWLDPGSMASFEYLAGGDSAVVSMQYSYLPSWISYLVDQVRAREAGRALFDEVYERWSDLPVDDRPRLYVFGESLGSFGAEAAFSGEADLRNRTDGALFVGAPGFNALHREFTEGRDPGSRQVEPVYREGRTVRFANDVGGGAPPTGAAWEGTRVLYLQHPSDPIVWWDTDLALQRPDWLREARGRDVLERVAWVPFVTFWQVTMDMPLAVDVPPGHGHRYTLESVDAWAAILRPDGWNEEQADRLRALVAPDTD